MLSDQVHFLIKSLNACHIGLCVIRKFYLLSAADAFCTPVEISHVYGTSDLTCYGMESCLPSLYRLACAFRCKCQVYHRRLFHFMDDAESNVAASLPVYRYAAKLAEQPSERTPEKFTFYHAVRFSSH